jgi:hypothetical protein
VSGLCDPLSDFFISGGARDRPSKEGIPPPHGGGGDPAVAYSKATLPWLPFRFPDKLKAFGSEFVNGYMVLLLNSPRGSTVSGN